MPIFQSKKEKNKQIALRYKKKKDLIRRKLTNLHSEEFLMAMSEVGQKHKVEIDFLMYFMNEENKPIEYILQLFGSGSFQGSTDIKSSIKPRLMSL